MVEAAVLLLSVVELVTVVVLVTLVNEVAVIVVSVEASGEHRHTLLLILVASCTELRRLKNI